MPRSAVKHLAEPHGDIWELEDDPRPWEETEIGADAHLRKSKAALYEEATAAGVEGRSKMTRAELVHALMRHRDRETGAAGP